MEAEATSRFSKYDSFLKLTNDRLKQTDCEIQEINNQHRKAGDETKRLCKVTQNIQKQIQTITLNPVKSYASVTNQSQTARNSSPKSNSQHCVVDSEAPSPDSNTDAEAGSSICSPNETSSDKTRENKNHSPSRTSDNSLLDCIEPSHMDEHTQRKLTVQTKKELRRPTRPTDHASIQLKVSAPSFPIVIVIVSLKLAICSTQSKAEHHR